MCVLLNVPENRLKQNIYVHTAHRLYMPGATEAAAQTQTNIDVSDLIFFFAFFSSLCSELQDGTLKENGVMDGSKIVLTPNVETGLLVS